MASATAEGQSGEILLVASTGGHLLQLSQLADLWPKEKRHWVTFEKADAVSLLADEQKTWAHWPTNRNLPNLIRNFRLAASLLKRRNIVGIVSTGAGVAVPFIVLGRLRGLKVVYVETMSMISSPSLTGRLVYPFASTFIVQWPELLRFFKRARWYGTVFDLR